MTLSPSNVQRAPFGAMADGCYAIALILNLTNTFIFAAPVIGATVGTVSTLMLGLNVLYLSYRLPILLRLIQRRTILLWIVLILVWPLVTLTYAPVRDLRAAGLQVYYITLMLGAACFTTVRGWHAFRRLIGVSIAITAIGLWLSWMTPDLFAVVAELVKAARFEEGRAAGFFIQPNVTGEAIVLLFVCWFASGEKPRALQTVLGVLLLLLMAGVTGSRSTLGAGLALALFVAYDKVRRRAGKGRKVTRGVLVLASTTSLLLAGIAIYLAASTLGSSLENTGAEGTFDRLTTIATGGISEALQSDVSLIERLVSIQQHAALVLARPLSGYGIGSTAAFIESGTVFLASHNIFLETAVNYGIPFVLFFLYCILKLVRAPGRSAVEREVGFALPLALAFAIGMLGMTSNTVLASRPLMITLGATLAMLVRAHAPVRIASTVSATVPVPVSVAIR